MLDALTLRVAFCLSQTIEEEKPEEVAEVKQEIVAPVPVEPIRVPDDRPPSVTSARVLTPDYKRPDTPRPPSVPRMSMVT